MKIGLPKREKVIAGIDIGSGSIGVALFGVPATGPSRVIVSARSLITLESETPEHSIAAIGDRFASVLKQLQEKMRGAPLPAVGEAHVIVHAPWAESKTSMAESRFEQPQPVRRETMVDLARKTMEGVEIDRSKLFEASIVRTWLNGYTVHEPEGNTATLISAVSILSESDPDLRASIEAAIRSAFPVAELSWHSGLHALLSVLGRVPNTDDSFCIVDMSTDATHLASVREGIISAQKIVTEGSRSILTRIAGTRMPEEVLGMMRMLARDACVGEACESIRNALAEAEPELARIFGEVFGVIAAQERIPNNLILVAHPDMTEWLTQFFTRIDFAQFTVTTLPFDVLPFGTTEAAEWVIAPQEFDAGLTIAASLVNMEAQS